MRSWSRRQPWREGAMFRPEIRRALQAKGFMVVDSEVFPGLAHVWGPEKQVYGILSEEEAAKRFLPEEADRAKT